MFLTLLRREALSARRNHQALLQPLVLYALLVCLFPLALGADEDSLVKLAPAALWLPLLLATVLAAEQLLAADRACGQLSQDVLHLELWLLLLAKIIIAWLRLVLPLLLLLPLLSLLLHLPPARLPGLLALLTLASLALLSLAAIGASLTLGAARATFLQLLIVLPLQIPLLLLGVMASRDYLHGLAIGGYYALLGALALFSLLCALPFGSLALRSHSLN